MTTPKPASAPPALLPCPFCGGRPSGMCPPTCNERTPYNPADRAFPIVRCACGVEVWGKDWDATGESAVKQWNRRAASAQVREVEPKYFDDVLHPDDPRHSPCTAADDTPSKSRAKRIALENGEPVAVAHGDAVSAALDYLTGHGDPDQDRHVDTILAHIEQQQATIADHARREAWMQAEIAELGGGIERLLADKCDLRCDLAEAQASLAACRADAERLDYIERTFSGMTNRERYLPVQMIWGKGCNGRTLREACDKYMRRDAARSQP